MQQEEVPEEDPSAEAEVVEQGLNRIQVTVCAGGGCAVASVQSASST